MGEPKIIIVGSMPSPSVELAILKAGKNIEIVTPNQAQEITNKAFDPPPIQIKNFRVDELERKRPLTRKERRALSRKKN